MLLVTSSAANSLASSNSAIGMSRRSSERRTLETFSGLASTHRSSRRALSGRPEASSRSTITAYLPLQRAAHTPARGRSGAGVMHSGRAGSGPPTEP
jgi:hypothetical protein